MPVWRYKTVLSHPSFWYNLGSKRLYDFWRFYSQTTCADTDEVTTNMTTRETAPMVSIGDGWSQRNQKWFWFWVWNCWVFIDIIDQIILHVIPNYGFKESIIKCDGLSSLFSLSVFPHSGCSKSWGWQILWLIFPCFNPIFMFMFS